MKPILSCLFLLGIASTSVQGVKYVETSSIYDMSDKAIRTIAGGESLHNLIGHAAADAKAIYGLDREEHDDFTVSQATFEADRLNAEAYRSQIQERLNIKTQDMAKEDRYKAMQKAVQKEQKKMTHKIHKETSKNKERSIKEIEAMSPAKVEKEFKKVLKSVNKK